MNFVICIILSVLIIIVFKELIETNETNETFSNVVDCKSIQHIKQQIYDSPPVTCKPICTPAPEPIRLDLIYQTKVPNIQYNTKEKIDYNLSNIENEILRYAEYVPPLKCIPNKGE